jgi:hypothetical protein
VPGVDALQVGLVEAREHALCVRGLELAVEVDLLVHRVDRAVQALAGGGVERVGVDHKGVLRREIAEDQPLLRTPARDVDRRTIQRGRPDAVHRRLDEGGRAGFGTTERDNSRRSERTVTGAAGAVGQVERDVVRGHVEDPGTFRGLDLR